MITQFSGGDFLFGTALGTEYIRLQIENQGPVPKDFKSRHFLEEVQNKRNTFETTYPSIA